MKNKIIPPTHLIQSGIPSLLEDELEVEVLEVYGLEELVDLEEP